VARDGQTGRNRSTSQSRVGELGHTSLASFCAIAGSEGGKCMSDTLHGQDHFPPGARRAKYRRPQTSWQSRDGPAQSKPVKATMNKYIRVIEQEIVTVKGWIERYQGVGAYHDNCVLWGHHVRAYERILELIIREASRSNQKPELSPLLG
jgi:hypothetical protein